MNATENTASSAQPQSARKAEPLDPRWWRKRADEIELRVAATGSLDAMRCYTEMRALLQAAESAPAVGRDRIREIFMAHGFTIKEGQADLKQYVYDAAYALLALAAPPTAQAEGCRLVPVDPTPAMAKAAADAWLDCGSRLVLNKAAAAVAAGIAAAPSPPASAEGVEHG